MNFQRWMPGLWPKADHAWSLQIASEICLQLFFGCHGLLISLPAQMKNISRRIPSTDEFVNFVSSENPKISCIVFVFVHRPSVQALLAVQGLGCRVLPGHSNESKTASLLTCSSIGICIWSKDAFVESLDSTCSSNAVNARPIDPAKQEYDSRHSHSYLTTEELEKIVHLASKTLNPVQKPRL